VTNTLTAPTMLDLRAEFEELTRRDLLGPAGGPNEIVDEPTVRGRYIVGLLAPRGDQGVSLDDLIESLQEVGDLATGGSDGEDGTADADVPLPDFAAMVPSAMGFTFCVDDAADSVQLTARWGKYTRVKSDMFVDAKGEPRLVWQRTPIEGTTILSLSGDFIEPWFPDPENHDVYVRGVIRHRINTPTVTLFLVNSQHEPEKRKDEAWLFQPELIVASPGNTPIFTRRPIASQMHYADAEDRMMSMMYRHQVEFAVGHGVGVEAKLAEGQQDRAVAICTSVIPSAEIERMDPPTADQIPELRDLVLDMYTLAEIPDGGFGVALIPLVQAYATWIEEQAERVHNPQPDLQPFIPDAEAALVSCREALTRIAAGINVLDSDLRAAQAFRFANRAMGGQRIRTLYARQVRQTQAASGDSPGTSSAVESEADALMQIDVPKNRSWRPFQMAFMLLNLPSIADPTHPERAHPTDAFADLLWFPTGGGKTEAYLGLAAFTIAIRRLQGEVGGRLASMGVAVLMRYTLRLLTLQQFQRATTLICVCELIRRDNPDLWGTEPFRIGLWVGRRSTPNWTKDAEEAVKNHHDVEWQGSVGGRGTPAQLTNCPWCGKPINPGRDITVETYEKGRGRTFQYCSDPQGICPFSRKQSPNDGLPIVVVDEEIYRLLPTLLIATVDKFAQMPWKGETQMLFGQVNGYCPRHGFRSPEIQDEDHHNKKGAFPACTTVPISPLRPPDLIIQDELHLISGPLGTLVGLYETAVDALASWEVNGVMVRPKVVASTATIRRATHQVRSLFMRQVKIFPPSGLDAEDNFFARRQLSMNEAPARRYIGICASGTRLKTVLIRVYVALMAAAQTLYEKYGSAADPYMTLVGYFNSMRELGGMKRVADDAVRSRLLRVGSRGLKRREIYPETVEELTSRKSAVDIPRILDRLEKVFSGKPAKGIRRPLDLVLATNMISVGVDVGRLGLMVVASQPKATAEYIQATSRVGRTFPGLVCTVYNWARPRDLSHYERFGHYHTTFYQQVEALSVTPFSPRALDRGLTGVLIAYMRLYGEDFNENASPRDFKPPHPYINKLLQVLSQREQQTSSASLVQSMAEQRLERWALSARAARANGARLVYQVPAQKTARQGTEVSLLQLPTKEDWSLFTCLNSLRDVEPNIALLLNDYGMDRDIDDSENEVASE